MTADVNETPIGLSIRPTLIETPLHGISFPDTSGLIFREVFCPFVRLG